jgi:hypothetical protein
VNDALFFAPVDRRPALARALWAEHGAALAAGPLAPAAVGELARLVEGVEEQMRAMGLPARCARCGALPAGGCCSREMAGEADVALLLINLAAGVDLVPAEAAPPPGPGARAAECRFLGPRGCALRCKPIFCLDYLCRAIRAEAPVAALAELRRRGARLLGRQVEIEAQIAAALVELSSGPC